MADPDSLSLFKPHFFQPLLPGFCNSINIPVKFFMKHIEGRTLNVTAKLRSDVSYKTWEVKMDGRRFTDGWRDFAVDHDFRIGDFVVFRHEGDLVFHVTGFGPSCCNLQYTSPGRDSKHDSDEHIGNVPRKEMKVIKNLKTGSKYTCLEVTASNLRFDRRFVPKNFARSNGLTNRWCEIDLMNEHGSSWTLDLRCRKRDGQVYIIRGWTSFCQANRLEAGSFRKFKMVGNGTKPAIRLCPRESSRNTDNCDKDSDAKERKSCSTNPHCRDQKNSSRESSKRTERRRASASSGQNRFVKLNITPTVLRTGHLWLSTHFTSSNGIEKSAAITLLDKFGVGWPSYLRFVKKRQWFYVPCRDFIKANGVKKGETFTLEFIRGDKTPILRFCSETQQEESEIETMADVNALKSTTHEETVQTEKSLSETETTTNKRARARVQGPTTLDLDQESRSKGQEDRHTDDATRSDPRTRSDPMAKAKQSITDALTAIRQFRDVLDAKEQNLEDSLRELDALGE